MESHAMSFVFIISYLERTDEGNLFQILRICLGVLFPSQRYCTFK